MSNQLYGYGMYYSGGNLVFETANNTRHTNYYANTGVTLHAGVWYHVVCTWNGTTVVTYLNGNHTVSASQITPTTFSTYDFALGKNLPTNTAGFAGTIDEVGVWNRVLTSSEVASLFNTGTGFQYPFGSVTNIPPMANAGTNQTLPAGTTSTTLTGTGIDADGTVASYAWKQTAGTTVTITSPNAPTTTVTGLTTGTYTFQLTVTDNLGATGTSTVNVTVNANIPPVANAGTNQTLPVGTASTTLTGSGTDADGTVASYSWKQTAGTTVTITSPNAPTTTVTGLTTGTYTFQLTVIDNLGATGTSTVNVTVNANIPPVANAGTNQTLPAGTTATTLNGTGTDADGTVASYAWKQTAGTTVTITSPNAATTTVTGLTTGTYTFQLTVTDNLGATSTSTVNVTVNSSAPPSTLLNGIISYWTLDEKIGSAIDATGGGNNGTPTL